MTGLEHRGVVDRWDFPDDGYGDCEDYQLRSASSWSRTVCPGARCG